jgi:hypothetical protein
VPKRRMSVPPQPPTARRAADPPRERCPARRWPGQRTSDPLDLLTPLASSLASGPNPVGRGDRTSAASSLRSRIISALSASIYSLPARPSTPPGSLGPTRPCCLSPPGPGGYWPAPARLERGSRRGCIPGSNSCDTASSPGGRAAPMGACNWPAASRSAAVSPATAHPPCRFCALAPAAHGRC